MSAWHNAVRALQVISVAGTVAFVTIMFSGTVRASLALVIFRTIAKVFPPDIVLIGDSQISELFLAWARVPTIRRD